MSYLKSTCAWWPFFSLILSLISLRSLRMHRCPLVRRHTQLTVWRIAAHWWNLIHSWQCDASLSQCPLVGPHTQLTVWCIAAHWWDLIHSWRCDASLPTGEVSYAADSVMHRCPLVRRHTQLTVWCYTTQCGVGGYTVWASAVSVATQLTNSPGLSALVLLTDS